MSTSVDPLPAVATSADPTAQDDHALLAAVRAGDTAAYGTHQRHAGPARNVAYALCRNATDAEDLVAEAFAKVLALLRRGHGPQAALRPYLLTTLRHLGVNRARSQRRLELTDDLSRFETGESFQDPADARVDRAYAARAFGKLPARWRAVLWHTEIEGGTPAQVAPLLGLTPNGVAVLAYRARERLRQMYLQEHVDCAARRARHQAAGRLGRYVRGGLPVRERSKVTAHLAGCPACRQMHTEISEVNARALPR